MRKFSKIISGVFLCLFSFASITDSNAQGYQWLRNGGGTGTDQGNCVINAAGNIWKGGQVSSGAVFKRPDGTTLSLPNAGAYVAQYINGKTITGVTYYGYALWVSNVQSSSGVPLPSNSYVKSIGRNGNFIYATGTYTISTDPYMFVAKFDAVTGAQIFPVYTAALAYGNGIAVTSTNVYVTGGYKGLVDFPTSPGGGSAIQLLGSDPECYVLKLDLNFNYINAISATSAQTSIGNGIYLNGTKFYVTGSFGNTSTSSADLTFSAQSVNVNKYNEIFVAQFETSTLSCNWLRNGGASTNILQSNDEGLGITGDASSIYITGRIETNGNFGIKTVPSSGGFTVKYNTSGTEQWAVIAHAQTTYAISTLNSQVYVAGNSVVRLDGTTGGNVWTVTLGNGSSTGYGITAGESCNVFVTGSSGASTWTAIPDPLTPSGTNDVYLTSISKDASVTAGITSGTNCSSTAFTLCASGASSYIWSTTPTQSTACINVNPCGTVYYTVIGNNGCSSIATVKVNSKISMTVQGGSCSGDLTVLCQLLNYSCNTGTTTRQWQYQTSTGNPWNNVGPANTNTHDPVSLGNYRMQITTPTCIGYSTSLEYNNTCRMANPSATDEGIRVSLNPNPAQAMLTISIDQKLDANATAMIMDVSGRIVADLGNIELQPGMTKSESDISSLSSGIYYLNVTIGEKVITKKLIKE